MMRLSIFMLILHFNYVVMYLTVSQPVHIKRVALRDSVTFECSCTADPVISWIWLKQTPEQGLVPIVTTYYGKVHYQGYFANMSRFKLQKDDLSFNWTIWNVASTDVGSYYCGILWYNEYYFGNGTYLTIQANESTQVNITKLDIKEYKTELVNYNTLLLVIIIICLIITNILQIIMWRRALHKRMTISSTVQNLNMEETTENYTALSFSTKRSDSERSRGYFGNVSGTHVVYAPIKQ